MNELPKELRTERSRWERLARDPYYAVINSDANRSSRFDDEARRTLVDSGERDVVKIVGEAKKAFVWQPAVQLDYLEIVDPDELVAMASINRKALVAVAAFVGKTRLIDNILLQP